MIQLPRRPEGRHPPTTINNDNNSEHDNNPDPLQLPLPSCEVGCSGLSLFSRYRRSCWVPGGYHTLLELEGLGEIGF